ncbi:MAG TPA: pre-peptidase C-terminal domain-containing protein, partial [Anaerolineaceae bacterium]|nr:pre-peptidase C-terminal domain-containing protein [Anaerolineaceae bacterium]
GTNDGVLRTCYEADTFPTYGTQCHRSPLNVFVSGNNGAFPPSGAITSPAAGTTSTIPTIRVEGTASDDQGVTKVAVLVNYDGTWREAGEPVVPSGGRFAADINLCEAGVPKGSFQIALRIWDLEGNQTQNYPGQRTLTNGIACVFTSHLSTPADGAALSNAALPVAGSWDSWAQVSSVEVLARQDGDWQAFPAQIDTTAKTFSANINLCQAGLDAGPITLKLRIKDGSGAEVPGTHGLRTIVSNFNCPATPPCSPGPSEVAVFSEPDYGGVCKILGVGSYASSGAFAPMTDNNVESIKVGVLAHAILFDGASYAGRTESFETSDANLADNLIGANTVSSLRVQQISSLYATWPAPPAPTLTQPSANLGRNPTSADSLVLTWSGAAGASQFQSKLTYPDGHSVSMSWRKTNSWSVGNLPAGTYTWWVMGGSYLGSVDYERRSAIPPVTFTVEPGSLPAASAQPLPYSDGLNAAGGDWTASGQWRWSNGLPDGREGYAFSNGTDYAGGARSGDLTSPPIQLPAGSAYFTFNYWYDSESIRPWWDQRRVQISVDGGPFTDLALLSEDPARVWLTSAPIDLTPYAGKSVRLRFHFTALDGASNGFQGWMIDSLSVQAGAPETLCPDEPGNNSLATAAPLTIGGSVSGRICRGGETDYYRFSGTPGQTLEIDVDAMETGSPLDPYLYLLDEQGNLVLENDDVIHTELRDSHITFTLPSDRPFYLRLRTWDYPSAY